MRLPTHKRQFRRLRRCIAALAAVAVFALPQFANAQWSDNFDSYPSDDFFDGLGGWECWDNVLARAPNTSTAQFLSAPNSVLVFGDVEALRHTDAVRQFSGYNSGQWRCTANLFIPTNYSGNEYFILLNQYTPGGEPKNWSIELLLNGDDDAISDDYQTGHFGVPIVRTGSAVPLTRGVWSQIRVDFDLTADTVTEYYNGTEIATGPWRTYQDSILNLAALDLYSESGDGIYFDNLSLTQIPEPAAAMLVALAVPLLLRRRKRVTTHLRRKITWPVRLTAKQAPHRPDTAPAHGLRAENGCLS
jgi:hypothetical protein